MKEKGFLQTILESTDWKEIYDEHYGKEEIEKELPKGEEMTKRFYTPDWWKRIKNK